MPITVHEDHDGIDLYVRIDAAVRPDELIDYFRDMTDRYESFDGKRALIETVGVRLEGFSFSSMSELAKLTKQSDLMLAGSRTAVVAKQAVVYGVVRMYISVREPAYDFAVFRDRDRARSWLLGAAS